MGATRDNATSCALFVIGGNYIVLTFAVIYLFHSVGTWSSPETTGPRPPPCAGFSFTKVDLSRAVLFGGEQKRSRVNEVHILDMDNWVSRYGIHHVAFIYSYLTHMSLSTGVELYYLPVQLTFGQKEELTTQPVLCSLLHHPLPQKVLPRKSLTHHPLT